MLITHVSPSSIIMSEVLSEILKTLDYNFSLTGVSETKINNLKDVDFDPSIPGYAFEHAPTPLASGGVGLYINDSLKYTVIEKTSEEAFQVLWIEIQFSWKSNIICGIYRQYYSPNVFRSILILEGEGSGVTRDVIDTFWQQLFAATTVSDREKIPCIRCDFQKKRILGDWKSVSLRLQGSQLLPP